MERLLRLKVAEKVVERLVDFHPHRRLETSSSIESDSS